ncbi:MAG: alpha/beta hydrolase [Polyangiaceae bacterium]
MPISQPPRERKPISYELHDVTVRNVRIRVVEAGRGNGPPLLLLHGFLATHAAFDDVVDEFAQDFHVIAPDLPGSGDSEKPSPARYVYGVDAFSETIADVVAAVAVGRVHVIGHSLGGAVGLTLAASHAELVHRLVVVDPLTFAFPATFRARLPLYPVVGPFVFKQLYGRALFRGHFREDIFAPPPPDAPASTRGVPEERAPMNLDRVDEYYDKFNTPASRESAYATLRSALDTRTLVARLGRVRAPTLVVWGRDDKLFPVSFASRLVKELADARLEIMEAGHSPIEERPLTFYTVAKQFLEGKR